MTLHTVAKSSGTIELKNFVGLQVVSVFLHEANDVGLYMWCPCWGYQFSYSWRQLVDVATWQI